MEKEFKKPRICEECDEELEQFFLFCRNCNKYICYDCFSNHEMKHDYLPCETLDNGNAIVIDVGDGGGYGPSMGNIWPITTFDSFISDYYSRCPHATEYFKKNNITFLCHKCEKWICLDCLSEHSNHDLMLNVGFNNGKDLRQIDPNLYDSNKDLLLDANVFKTTGGDIKLELDIINDNTELLYDLRVMYTFKGLDHTLWCGNAGETIDNEDYLCNNITYVEMISPNESMKIKHEFFVSEFLNYDLSTIITIVRYKDVYLGNGIVLKKNPLNIR